MSIAAIVPVAQLAAANAALELAGFGPGNFSVPAYGATGATHAALHAWKDAAFREALALVPGVVVGAPEDEGDPITLTAALIEAQGAKWGAQAPALPSTGNVTAGSLYRLGDSLWSVIQSFNRTIYRAYPSTYPALIRRVRDPYKAEAWRQPLDQYDSYKLVNAFTGKADECVHGGKFWRSKVDNNVWEPTAQSAEWEEIDAQGNVVVPPAPPVEEWPAWKVWSGHNADLYQVGAKVTHKGDRWVSNIPHNHWAPGVYGWTQQP